VTVRARAEDGSAREFRATVRVDTPEELTAFRHGGILPYVARRLAKG
jgi:aconitate hydratase